MIAGYLFDSHALLAFFQKERGTEVVAKILRRAMKERLDRLICVINLGEIIYITKRRFGDNKKLEVLGRVHQLGFNVLPVPESLVFKAAELKAEYPIAYADCFALSCAIERSAILVTGDPGFKKVAHLVNIQWIC
ncbi:MAG: type II toxin-antitoxin system VapC family toxin [Thermodesulfobacteriota bacterium]|nr:type II toxin-antitoxin system VapC family toxin [Thermodesulfobacteriota bacterium]